MEPHACNSCSFVQSAVATSEITCDLPTLEQCKSKDFLKSRFFRWPPPISKSVTFGKHLNCRSLKYLWYSKTINHFFESAICCSIFGWPNVLAFGHCVNVRKRVASPQNLKCTIPRWMSSIAWAFFLELRLQSGKKIRSESNQGKRIALFKTSRWMLELGWSYGHLPIFWAFTFD